MFFQNVQNLHQGSWINSNSEYCYPPAPTVSTAAFTPPFSFLNSYVPRCTRVGGHIHPLVLFACALHSSPLGALPLVHPPSTLFLYYWNLLHITFLLLFKVLLRCPSPKDKDFVFLLLLAPTHSTVSTEVSLQ